jgi:hypothetical protein
MKFSIALFAILSVAVQAAPMQTCGAQAECLDFNITEVEGNLCSPGSCEFVICMTVNQGKDNCEKSGSISHTCEKSDSTCALDDGFSGITATEGIGDGYTSCQTVSAGDTAEFLMKDGNSNGLCGTGTSGIASCEKLEIKYPDYDGSCTGNEDLECRWFVEAPACTDDTTDTDTDTDSDTDSSERLGVADEDDTSYLCS